MVGAQDPDLVGQQLLGQLQRARGVSALGLSSQRCCRGWPGLRDGRGPGPGAGRAAAPGTAAARPRRLRARPSRRRCCRGWPGRRDGRGPGPGSGRAAAPGTAAARPAASPRSPVQPAMLPRVVRTSGWSGPRTRIWSGSSSWDRMQRARGVSALARPASDVAAGGQDVGMVGAQDPDLVGQQLLE